jgi:CelD/BcsL family acetyltransferase involved in cellulose biosynthesis
VTQASASRASPPLQVALTEIQDIAALEREWRTIEQSDRISFFQTWDWIGSLLESLPVPGLPLVLRVLSKGRVVALGLLSRSADRRRKVIRTRTLHLNETGVPDYDCITFEHNGLLTEIGFEEIAIRAVLDYLITHGNWDELYLGGLASENFLHWSRAARATRLWSVTRWEKPNYCVDLDQVRNAGGVYLNSLSANTRYQIRRAKKIYATRGELRLRYAASVNEAHQWLQQLIRLHQDHWRAKEQPGAFATNYTNNFHTALIRRAWPRGAVEIAQVRAGESVLGYLYNFRKGNVLYNYQSAFAYEDDSKLKPGLVCHALAAESALERGLSKYDLLAGGGHYKQSLTNATGTMVWAVLQQKRLLIGIENGLRNARDRWRALRPPPVIPQES